MSYFSTLSNLYKTYFLSAIVRLLQPLFVFCFGALSALSELHLVEQFGIFVQLMLVTTVLKAGIEVRVPSFKPRDSS